jgi:hypothetical protein
MMHKFLTSAVADFERAALPYGECDFWWEFGAEREFRDAPAPFTVESFDSTERREWQGRQLITDGAVGVQLLDANGRIWRKAGVWVEGDLVKDARGYLWLKDHVAAIDGDHQNGGAAL